MHRCWCSNRDRNNFIELDYMIARKCDTGQILRKIKTVREKLSEEDLPCFRRFLLVRAVVLNCSKLLKQLMNDWMLDVNSLARCKHFHRPMVFAINYNRPHLVRILLRAGSFVPLPSANLQQIQKMNWTEKRSSIELACIWNKPRINPE